MKKYIGKLISLKIRGRKSNIKGIVLDYNSEWTLLKYNPVDYITDGYIVINNKKVANFSRSKEDAFVEKIIKLKSGSDKGIDVLAISNLKGIITLLELKYSLIELELNSESVAYIGYPRSVDNNKFELKTLKPNGKKGARMEVAAGDVRTISFDNDYINSLKLYLRDQSEKS